MSDRQEIREKIKAILEKVGHDSFFEAVGEIVAELAKEAEEEEEDD